LSADAPFAAYVLWSIYRMVFFWLAFNASVNLPQLRRSVRFRHHLICEISNNEGNFVSKAYLEDISETGAKIRTKGGKPPARFKLSIPQLSLYSIQSAVIRSSRTDGAMGVEFQECSLANKRKLIEFIYCEPGRWDKSYLPERTAFRALGHFFAQWLKMPYR
jgi:cellulose synthase (UDP-forming)